MIYLNGWPFYDGDISWQVQESLIGEETEGIRLAFHFSGSYRQYQRRDTLINLKSIIKKKDEAPWIKPTEEAWIIDLDKLKEAFPDVNKYTWIKGMISIPPEFEPEAIHKFDKTEHKATIAFYITPESLKNQPSPATQIETSPKSVLPVISLKDISNSNILIGEGIKQSVGPNDSKTPKSTIWSILNNQWIVGIGVGVLLLFIGLAINPTLDMFHAITPTYLLGNTTSFPSTQMSSKSMYTILPDGGIELYHDDEMQNGMDGYGNPSEIRAVRFTPPKYPFRLNRVKVFLVQNSSVRIRVFDNAGSNGSPGNDLIAPFEKDFKNNIITGEWHELQLPSSVLINSGDFYVGIEVIDFNHPISLGTDTANPIDNRSYWKNQGFTWNKVTDVDYMIRASGIV